jgi:hypothetical protein
MTVYLSSKEKVLQMIKDLKEIGVIKWNKCLIG